jgi:uroporphyrinogen III methyltransferase/synthase
MADTSVIVTTFDYERSPIFFNTLNEHGFSVESLPVLSLSLNENLSDFDACVQKLHKFNLVVFSSPSVVMYFFMRLKQLGIEHTRLDNCLLVAIGSATAKALRQRGVTPEFVPREFTSNSLMAMLNKLNGRWKILIPCSNKSLWHEKNNFPAGCKVSAPVLYNNNLPRPGERQYDFDLLENEFDVIAFTSPSTIENLAAIYDQASITEILDNKIVACIGPTTAKACSDRGIPVAIQPRKYTITSLMWSIIYHLQACKNRSGSQGNLFRP